MYNYFLSFSLYYFSHNFIFFFIFIVSVFVFCLIVGCVFFHSYFSFIYNAIVIEFFWTFFPLLIILFLLFPLFFFDNNVLLFSLSFIIMANQWYWTSTEFLNSFYYSGLYNSPLFISLPLNTTSLLFLSSNDVLHSFGLNSLFLKSDCVPGVINSVFLNLFFSNIYFVQCTELCGINHSLMPMFIYSY
jgi:heme/copper-type cytochrome/quinol oxidase subunit 2